MGTPSRAFSPLGLEWVDTALTRVTPTGPLLSTWLLSGLGQRPQTSSFGSPTVFQNTRRTISLKPRAQPHAMPIPTPTLATFATVLRARWAVVPVLGVFPMVWPQATPKAPGQPVVQQTL